jgi:pSer/pThr/pTyr-binding forkhead associated (FHA) protein
MGVRLHVRSLWGKNDEEVLFEFDQDRILIGRGRGADVCLPHRAVSLRHATIELSPRGYTLVDHDSTNGTRATGARLVAGRPKPLRDSDQIEIGGFAIVFRCGVAVSIAPSPTRTTSLARRLAREALDQEERRSSITIVNGPSAGKRLVLPDPPARILIGRGEHCELPLNDADASREHAEIEVGLDGARIRDLDSKNGIQIGDRTVRERLLDDRDEVRIGSTVLSFEDSASARVRSLEEGEDNAIDTPIAGEPKTEPKVDESGPEEPVPVEPPPPRPKKPKSEIAPADVVIYVLAAAVFAFSVLGLLWLLRSG